MTSLCYLGKPAEGTALPKLFERASAEMSRTDYKVWGINIAMDPWSAPKEDVVAHDLIQSIYIFVHPRICPRRRLCSYAFTQQKHIVRFCILFVGR